MTFVRAVTAAASERHLSQLESIGLGLVSIGVAVLLIGSAVAAYATPRPFIDDVLEWPPNLALSASVGVISCLISISKKAKAPLLRRALVFAMLLCGFTLVGTLSIAYGYAFVMSDFN